MPPVRCFRITTDDVKYRLCALAMKSILTHNIINFTAAIWSCNSPGTFKHYYEMKKKHLSSLWRLQALRICAVFQIKNTFSKPPIRAKLKLINRV